MYSYSNIKLRNLVDFLHDIKDDFKYCFNSKKKTYLFLVFLPLVIIIIKIQIIFFIFFSTIFIIMIILSYFFKLSYNLKYPDLDYDSNFLKRFVLFKLFIEIPYSRSYVFVYNVIYFIKNFKFKIFSKNTFFLLLIVVLIFFFRIFFIYIVGFSYFSFKKTAEFNNCLHELNYFKYESKEAFIQTLILNAFLIDNITEYAQELVIKFNLNGEFIELNPNAEEELRIAVAKFLFKEFLYKAFSPYNSRGARYISFKDNQDEKEHFYTCYFSRDGTKNICTSFTHSNKLLVNNNDNIEYKSLEIKLIPNLYGQNKINFMTFPHSINMKEGEVKECFGSVLTKLRNLSSLSYYNILENMNKPMYKYQEGEFKYTGMTVKEYILMNNFFIERNIKLFDSFLEKNKEMLSTKEGKEAFEIIKLHVLTNPHLFYKYEHLFKSDQ